MKYLLDNKLAPLTFSWGFLEAPVEAVNNSYVSWQKKILQSVKVQAINLSLTEALRKLEPLDTGSQRVLFLSTKGNWTACFDNGAKGGNPATFVGELAERLKCRGLAVGCVPNTLTKSDRGKLGTWGAVKFTLFGPEARQHLNIERSVSVINDVRGWKFDAIGTVQPFEQVDRYAAKRIAERFTPEMLEEYGRALGIELFDENFYGGAGFLTYAYPWFLPRLPGVTLTDARKQLGFVD